MPNVNVALGGGGGKGIVHLGVLKALDELGLTISALVGTSIGALWAAILAKMIHRHRNQHKAIEHLTKEVVHFDPEIKPDLLKIISRRIVKSETVERWLAIHLFDASKRTPFTFDSLSVDLHITAANASTGESIVFNKKTTPDVLVQKAVRASMSIPGVFEPIVLDVPDGTGKTKSVACWDGGITGNCRLDIAARLSQHPVIASSLTYRNDAAKYAGGLMHLRSVSDHAADIMLAHVESLLFDNLGPALQAKVCLLRPPLSDFTTFSFRKTPEERKTAIQTSYDYSKQKLQECSDKLGVPKKP